MPRWQPWDERFPTAGLSLAERVAIGRGAWRNWAAEVFRSLHASELALFHDHIGCAGTGVVGVTVNPVPLPTRVFLACGMTDMRKGFDGLAVLVRQVLREDPHSGALFAFRGKRGHLLKLLRFDGQGLCLFSKALELVERRLDRGRFVWPVTATGTVVLTPAQLSMLLEGIDWRRPERTFTPTLAG